MILSGPGHVNLMVLPDCGKKEIAGDKSILPPLTGSNKKPLVTKYKRF